MDNFPSYLKIKVISLADEARKIRNEERKLKALGPIGYGDSRSTEFWGLRHHRTVDIRGESRSAGLAWGFLKGRAYRKMEQIAYSAPNWKKIEKLVMKYGADRHKEGFAEWLKLAEESENLPVKQAA